MNWGSKREYTLRKTSVRNRDRLAASLAREHERTGLRELMFKNLLVGIAHQHGGQFTLPRTFVEGNTEFDALHLHQEQDGSITVSVKDIRLTDPDTAKMVEDYQKEIGK